MSSTAHTSPLGRQTPGPDHYDPGLLFAIGRCQSRRTLGLDDVLPFAGTDIWNAWELTWLEDNGQPQVAACEIRVPADSPSIIESKSLKLYLNSFSMSRYESGTALADVIRDDLCRCTGGAVEIRLRQLDKDALAVAGLPGTCIDHTPTPCSRWEVDADLLRANPATVVSEALHSHVLRSLCPVTSQPDCGSVLVEYTGPRIDPAALLQYVVSFRKHQDFHESCVERMFLDILERCACQQLTVYARYQRRGGIDINPFRTNTSDTAQNLRLWRQ
ncbi:MAG TPA: NADPH-dependent 7-cyano-7-deazaguanine reductase QueF [Woeseiaceae bacterium]|nr:NADPH-dependent 7-cyano-7-deazaguanine reductase QueF [Woeseiaceae bacterium]